VYRYDEALLMQRFVAELSNPIDKAAFEKSWHSDAAVTAEPKVEFAFVGRTVSVLIHSDISKQWPSIDFRQSFSAAVRRLDRVCNVRWL